MESCRQLVEVTGRLFDAAGVCVIVLGVVIASVQFVTRFRFSGLHRYRTYRHDLGRAILLASRSSDD